jgi:cysteine synthase
MKKKTLLEKAKESKIRKIDRCLITKEHIELAIAWAKDEISSRQVARALFKNEVLAGRVGGAVLYKMATYLRQGFREKKIVTKRK